jgi:hypothetical protein
VETQRTSCQPFSVTKTVSYKLKHSLSLFELAEQSGLLDLSKEYMASIGMLLEG